MIQISIHGGEAFELLPEELKMNLKFFTRQQIEDMLDQCKKIQDKLNGAKKPNKEFLKAISEIVIILEERAAFYQRFKKLLGKVGATC